MFALPSCPSEMKCLQSSCMKSIVLCAMGNAKSPDHMQYPGLVDFPWLLPLSPSIYPSKMQQLVTSALFQLQQQQEHLPRQQQRQLGLHTTGPSQTAASNAYLSSTQSGFVSQQRSTHQPALPQARASSQPHTGQSSAQVQGSAAPQGFVPSPGSPQGFNNPSGAPQGFTYPPGAACSMPQSSRRMQVPAISLPDGSGSATPARSSPADCRVGPQGRAACAPVSGPRLSQVAEAMEDQTVVVRFPMDLPGHQRIASAKKFVATSLFGEIRELSLVTTWGIKAPTMTCRRLLYILQYPDLFGIYFVKQGFVRVLCTCCCTRLCVMSVPALHLLQ